jgi:hypothetical protein
LVLLDLKAVVMSKGGLEVIGVKESSLANIDLHIRPAAPSVQSGTVEVN